MTPEPAHTMQALRIYAGPKALAHLQKNGLQAQDIGVVPGAAGGPKGLILGPLDRFIFGEWLAKTTHPVHLVGASIGAWRMATACLDQPVAGFKRLEHVGQSLQNFYGGKVQQVLTHPRFRLHIVTSRGRHVLGREHKIATPLGYFGAFLTNSVYRKAMGAWLERVVFSTPDTPLPFATTDYKTRQVALSEANFKPALQASCSIPFVLRSVHNIPGAPPGAYWDGGITDYHLHLDYATDLIARYARQIGAAGQNDADLAENVNTLATEAGLVLYPHFQQAVVPGWLDKGLKWRHKATRFLDNMILLAPNPEWVKTLPNAKLPDRTDFTRYGPDLQARVKAWSTAAAAGQQLADEWAAWLARPDAALVRPL